MRDLTWEEEKKICNKCKHRGGGSEWCAAVPGDYCEVQEKYIELLEEDEEKYFNGG